MPPADQLAAPLGVSVRPRVTFSDPLSKCFIEDPVGTTSTGLMATRAADSQHRECLDLSRQHGHFMSVPSFDGEVLHPERRQSSAALLNCSPCHEMTIHDVSNPRPKVPPQSDHGETHLHTERLLFLEESPEGPSQSFGILRIQFRALLGYFEIFCGR